MIMMMDFSKELGLHDETVLPEENKCSLMMNDGEDEEEKMRRGKRCPITPRDERVLP